MLVVTAIDELVLSVEQSITLVVYLIELLGCLLTQMLNEVFYFGLYCEKNF